jgi:hypothetical protein
MKTIVGLVVALAIMPLAVLVSAATIDPLEIRILGNRADLVSGGDALVEIVVPAKVPTSSVRVDVDGRDVTGGFALSGNGRFMGRVEGLRVGPNLVTARANGAPTARLSITNHPIGGPVFAGAQVQPWICNTVANGFGPPLDEQCNVPTRYELFYRSTNPLRTGFVAYDAANPPLDVATTTTDRGVTVPYIARRETGVMDRGWYSLAVLFHPSQPWEPWAPQRGWNGKVSWGPFGGSSLPDHYQRNPPNVLIDERLAAGFMVANSSLNAHGQNMNDVVSAEVIMMMKERIVERYGEIRFVIGEGCSGGALLQHLHANAYPGLLDGIQPSCSFTDSLTNQNQNFDCGLLDRYFSETSPHLWTAEQQRAAVSGEASWSGCIARVYVRNYEATTTYPDGGCGGSPDEPWVYDAEANPEGTRCTGTDYMVAVWGRRDPEQWGPVERRIGRGFARKPWSNEGVQYGLVALQSGEILPEQFVDLNEKIGGRDIDHDWTAERTPGDPVAQAVAYRTGRVNDGRQLDQVPIIDLRPNSNLEFHPNHQSYSMRERLLRANGHADNQVIFTTPVPLVVPPEVAAEAFSLMNQWLTAIEADTSADPRAVKVLRHKPAGAVDACFPDGVTKITDQAKCRVLFPYFGSSRTAAGGPLSNQYVKCQLQPLNPADYLPVTFSDAQWARLQATFPTGVCDWNRPPVDEEPSQPWMTFTDGPGLGRPLGPPPVSTSGGAK